MAKTQSWGQVMMFVKTIESDTKAYTMDGPFARHPCLNGRTATSFATGISKSMKLLSLFFRLYMLFSVDSIIRPDT